MIISGFRTKKLCRMCHADTEKPRLKSGRRYVRIKRPPQEAGAFVIST